MSYYKYGEIGVHSNKFLLIIGVDERKVSDAEVQKVHRMTKSK
ncbi:hypothetical protein [Tuberibacillus sp. Marseille-P3662]|nr:hypothetical protein [Tuberibacillus sp. Marseille-P3662]